MDRPSKTVRDDPARAAAWAFDVAPQAPGPAAGVDLSAEGDRRRTLAQLIRHGPAATARRDDLGQIFGPAARLGAPAAASGAAPVQRVKIFMPDQPEVQLIDTDQSSPFAMKSQVKRWDEPTRAHALKVLLAIEARNPKEGELLALLQPGTGVESAEEAVRRDQEIQAARRAQGARDKIMTTGGAAVRAAHAREAGVWKHEMVPADAPDPAVDAHPRITPKDVTPHGAEYHMQFTAEDPQGLAEIEAMAAIASHEGFRLVISVNAADQSALRDARIDHVAGVRIVVVPSRPSEWAEDSGEFLKGGAVARPAHPKTKGLEGAIKSSREARDYAPQAPFVGPLGKGAKNPAARIGHGVHDDRKGGEKQEIAERTGRRVEDAVAYLEGGNLLAGTDLMGRPYALVGRDAIAATCHLNGWPEVGAAAEKRVMPVLCRDLGLPPECILLVEQPGQFHLDMGMAVMPGGTVLLNDSMEVARLMRSWFAADRRLVAEAAPDLRREDIEAAFNLVETTLEGALRERAAMEARSLADLQKAGGRLSIVRLPASFPQTPFTPEMNFLNGETGTGPDGRSFFITNGGDARAEDVVSTAYFRALGTTKLARIYFADSGPSEASLLKGGGIGCRTKTAPNPDDERD